MSEVKSFKLSIATGDSIFHVLKSKTIVRNFNCNYVMFDHMIMMIHLGWLASSILPCGDSNQDC